jgi:hypothetical protein
MPPTPEDLALAQRLWTMADRRGFSCASSDRKRARFLAGREEHGDDLAALDLMGEALQEVDDAFIYAALEFILRPRPGLVAVLIKCRELEAALLACLPPERPS